MGEPVISVVVATRNRGHYLQDALVSILSQEVDLVVKVVRTQGDEQVPGVPAISDDRVEILECPHSFRGSDGWATGLSTVTTPWSMTFDDDDLMFPGSLRRMLEIAEHHELDMASGLALALPESVRWEDMPTHYAGVRTYEDIPEESVPLVNLYGWVDVAGGYFPGMGKTVWRSWLNAGVIGINQPPPGDSFFATKLFATAPTSSALCRVFLRGHRKHAGQATERTTGENLREWSMQYLAWACANYPEYAAARNIAMTSGTRPPGVLSVPGEQPYGEV